MSARRSFSRRQRLLRLLRVRKRSSGFLMEPAGFDGVAIAILEPADEHLISLVGQVHGREHQHGQPVPTRAITTAAVAPAVPATMKLAPVHEKSSSQTSRKLRSDVSAMAPAINPVLMKK